MGLGIIVFGVLFALGWPHRDGFPEKYAILFLVGLAMVGACLITPVIRKFLVRLGFVNGSLFGARKPRPDIHKNFRGRLNEARNLKSTGEYYKATILINRCLEADPNWPEALLLKAQVLWEGFNNPDEAGKHLKRVVQLTSKNDWFQKEALELQKKMTARPPA